MTEQMRYLQELRQTMNVCVSTFFRLSGVMPNGEELYQALGSRYLPVIREYEAGQRRVFAG